MKLGNRIKAFLIGFSQGNLVGAKYLWGTSIKQGAHYSVKKQTGYHCLYGFGHINTLVGSIPPTIQFSKHNCMHFFIRN